MRFRLPSVSAIRLATTMVTAASQKPICAHTSYIPENATPKTRMNAAKAAALTPVDISAVTGVGAPS